MTSSTSHDGVSAHVPKSVLLVIDVQDSFKGDAATWNDYLKRHVHAPQDHYAYLESVGIRKLLGLYTHPIVSW